MKSDRIDDQRRLVKICGGGVTRRNARSKTASGRLYEADQAFFQCGTMGVKRVTENFEEQAKAASSVDLHFRQARDCAIAANF